MTSVVCTIGGLPVYFVTVLNNTEIKRYSIYPSAEIQIALFVVVQGKRVILVLLQGHGNSNCNMVGVKSTLFVLAQGYMEQYLQQCTEANSSIYYTAYMKVIC